MQASRTDLGGGDECLVILNHKLEDSEIHQLLSLKAKKLKVCTGTLPYTCMFPKSSVAFMIIPACNATTQWPPDDSYTLSKALSQNLVKFSKLHHKIYFLLSAPILTDIEQKLLAILQQQYIGYDIQFLPVHNANETVECMLSIAKVTSKPLSDVIKNRLVHVEEKMLAEDKLLEILSAIGLNKHCSVLMFDGCGSLASIVKASCNSDTLIEYSVKGDQAKELKKFFSEKL